MVSRYGRYIVLYRQLANGVFQVWAVGPGFLLTGLGGMPEMRETARKMGAGHPSAGGDILRRVAEGERDADVGKVINANGISAL